MGRLYFCVAKAARSGQRLPINHSCSTQTQWLQRKPISQTELSFWNRSLARTSKSLISSIDSHASPDATAAASNFASSEAIDWTTPADRHGRKMVSFAAATSFTTDLQVLLKERDSLIHVSFGVIRHFEKNIQIFGGQMDRKIIAPYVKESRLPDLETSIRIADQALLYFKSVERQCQGKVTPGACVALALYNEGFESEERIKAMAKMSGKTFDAFMKVVSETRAILGLPFTISFEQLAEGAHLPKRLAATAKKVFDDLKAEFSEDDKLNRAGIYAAVMLVIAVKRGFKKELTVRELARVTSADPEDILKTEVMIRELIGKKYGLTVKKSDERVSGEAGEDVKLASAKAMEAMAKEQKSGKKKKVQQKLDFGPVQQ